MHQFRDKAGAARERVSAGPALLPGPDGRRRARLPRPRGAGGRGPARAHRADARRRGGLQQALRRDARRCPRATSRRSAPACATSRSPSKKMSTTGGTPEGTVYVDEEPASDRQEVQAARRPTRGREIVRARRQAGHLEPDRDPRRRARHRARRDRARFRRARATATSRPRSARKSPRGWRPCASATWSCARTRRRSRSLPEIGAAKAAAIAAPVVARRARGDGRRQARPKRHLAFRGVRIAQLELDLDVFAGPFDLLLSLILREELDLLEVDLAEVVIAYLDHLESARRARSGVRDRVPGADRGAAGAQVAADAPGRGGRGARRARARRGGRGAGRADAAVRPLPRRGRPPAPSATRTARAFLLRSRRLPRVAAQAVAGERARRRTTRPCWARRSARCCACRRRSTSATWRCRASRSAERLAHPARPAAPRHASASTTRSRTPTASRSA